MAGGSNPLTPTNSRHPKVTRGGKSPCVSFRLRGSAQSTLLPCKIARLTSVRFSRLRHQFLRNLKWVRPISGARNWRRVDCLRRPAFVLRPPPPGTALRFAPGDGSHTDLTPCRVPYVLSPPALSPQTPTKHPALRLRGGRRTPLRCAPFPVLLRGLGRSGWGFEAPGCQATRFLRI